jgi:hypothetical protein
MPVHADLTGAKAVFVSSRSGLARQAVDDAALFMIDASGDIQPVAFTDEQGKQVDLAVSGEVRNLARTFLTFDFALGGQARSADDEQHTALVELDTGKIYDFSGKQADTAIGKKELLYQNNENARSFINSPLYYWNMNSENAIPLNNIDVDSYGGGIIVPQKNNTIIVNSGHFVNGVAEGRLYVYDLTAKKPPEYFTGTLFHNVTNFPNDVVNMNLAEQIPIITLNKTLYSFWINGKDIVVNKDGEDIETLAGAGISGENAILNMAGPHTFYNYASMYIYKSGVLSITPTVDDEDITYSWTPRDLSFTFDGRDYLDYDVQSGRVRFIVRNGKVYYLSEKTIRIADPKTDDAYAVYFNGADYGANTIWMVNDDIYFTKYETATSVSTYRLENGATTPIQISTSEISMQSIKELTF